MTYLKRLRENAQDLIVFLDKLNGRTLSQGGESIYFQVGFINKKLDIKQFETPRSCQDNELWRTISETEFR